MCWVDICKSSFYPDCYFFNVLFFGLFSLPICMQSAVQTRVSMFKNTDDTSVHMNVQSLLENSLALQWAHSGLAAVTRWIWFGFLIFQHESALVFDPNISKHWKDGCRDRGDIGGGKRGGTTDWFVNSKAKGNSRCFRCPKESTARADCSNSLLLRLAANKNSIYMIKLDLFL